MDLTLIKKLIPVPDLGHLRRALFVGPHPDDIEIGAGGIVHKLVASGTEVVYVIVTDGGCGSMDPEASIAELIRIRRDESIAAAQFLGVQKVEQLSFPDGGNYEIWDVAIKIAEIIADFRPEAVFAPDPDQPAEIHPDHLRTSQAARTAVLMATVPLVLKRNEIPFEAKKCPKNPGMILAYYYTHRPNCFVALSAADAKAKLDSIRYHKSQVGGLLSAYWLQLTMYLDLRQKGFGAAAGAKQAEAFFAMAPVHQHCFPEINDF